MRMNEVELCIRLWLLYILVEYGGDYKEYELLLLLKYDKILVVFVGIR